MVERFDNHDQNDRGWIPEDEDLVYRGQADHSQHASTFDVMNRAGITVDDLWPHYLNMGGDIDEYEVDAYLHRLMRLPAIERDLISQAVNEMIDDIARRPRAPLNASRNTDAPDPDADPEQQVLSVVYSSAATRSFSQADLSELLTTSRRTNLRSHLTGVLLYCEDHFLQVLEGPEAILQDRMAIIRADRRHDRVRILIEETRPRRQFPTWDMGYGTIGPAMSMYVSGYQRTFLDEDDDADPAATLQVLRNLIQWFKDRPAASLR